MPRYFFHIRDRNRLVEDEEGLELSTPDQALKEAQASGRDLLRDALLDDIDIGHQIIEVTDETGAVLHHVRLSVQSEDLSQSKPSR